MKFLKGLAAVGLVALTAGCETDSDFFQEQRAKAIDDYLAKEAVWSVPADKVFTLQECVKSAIDNNLDIQLERVKSRISDDAYMASVLGMLPDLTVSSDWSERNNESGSTSESLINPGQTETNFSKSSQRQTQTNKIEMMFSVIDFGMSYYNSQQASDKRLYQDELTRRTEQNVAFEVAQAYFEVAVAQKVMTEAQQLIEANDEMSKKLDVLSADKTIAPLSAITTGIDILSVKQRLKDYRKTYINNCIRLAKLMGYNASTASQLHVDTSILEDEPTFNVPELNTLEHLALESRPELKQSDINSHIAVLETRKAILSMFPNVNVTQSWNQADNKYLYNDHWRQIGANAAMNLFDLPSKFYNYKVKDAEAKMMSDRTLNLTLGIMAQVHIAYNNIKESTERYDTAARIFRLSKKKLQLVKDKQAGEGALSAMAVLQTKTETHMHNIMRLNELSQAHTSYRRLMNSVGVEDLAQKPQFVERVYRKEINLDEAIFKIETELVNAPWYDFWTPVGYNKTVGSDINL